jgi:hypothetical protein
MEVSEIGGLIKNPTGNQVSNSFGFGRGQFSSGLQGSGTKTPWEPMNYLGI